MSIMKLMDHSLIDNFFSITDLLWSVTYSLYIKDIATYIEAILPVPIIEHNERINP